MSNPWFRLYSDGKRGVKLECDHIIPVSRGGCHDIENLATSCFDCNRSKRAKTLNEWLASEGSKS